MTDGTRQITRRRPIGRRSADRPPLFTKAFVTVAIAELAYFTADGVLLPALPRYVEGELGGTNVAIGVVVGAFSISAFFLRPWAGSLADRRGRRHLMIAGASIWAASVAGYFFADTVPSLVLMRLVTGVGEALFFVGALAANVDLAPPQRRGEAFSFASLALYAGLGAGPFIGEALIGRSGFGAVWITAIGLALVAAVLALRLPPMRPDAAAVHATTHRRLVHPAGLVPGLVLLAAIWGMGGFLTFVPLYALDLGMDGAGLVLGLFAGVVVLVRSAGATIPDRVGPGRTLRSALVLAASGLALVGAVQTPTGLIVGTALFGLGIALFTPALFTIAVDGVPTNERGAVMGTTSAFLDVALGVGPATLGGVAAITGRAGVFVAGALVVVVGFAVSLVTGLGRRTGPMRPA
ncbi:MAG TPA: MFS transporter [Actinomycetota bacterium]|nr:MFS transporter [Actinomycetota bacterium]